MIAWKVIGGDREYTADDIMMLERAEGNWKFRVQLMFSNWKGSHTHYRSFKSWM
ncbi:hypothetical protein CHISP_3534 [Chitinispirillum alkaliphilum]|nr:hypothetical protein CHISP_3534 [Chitinispirillum alkaliphilum]